MKKANVSITPEQLAAGQRYEFHEDGGHGWLKVTRADLDALGIAGFISVFSYITPSEQVVYLEEDCDASHFFRAYKKAFKGFPGVNALEWDSLTKRVWDGDWSYIRNLPHYQP